MSRIKLNFDIKYNKEIAIKNYEVIRLKGGMRIVLKDGTTKNYYATIDTGAHTSVLPLSIWKNLNYKKIGEYNLRGIIKREEWRIPVDIGKIKCMISDECGNQTKELEITAFLVHSDEVPLVLGFNGLLENINLFVSYKTNTAYAEC